MGSNLLMYRFETDVRLQFLHILKNASCAKHFRQSKASDNLQCMENSLDIYFCIVFLLFFHFLTFREIISWQ